MSDRIGKDDLTPPLLVRLDEAARQLSASVRTIRRMIDAGELPMAKCAIREKIVFVAN